MPIPNLVTRDNDEKKSFSHNVLDISRTHRSRSIHSNQIVSIAKIVINPKFQNIFPIRNEILSAITDSIRQEGFDPLSPLTLWTKNSTVVDGHTRLQAAKIAGLSHVPVNFVNFKNEEAIINHIYTIQFLRRNLSCPDRINFLISYLNTIKERPPYLRQQLAKILNMSEITVYKYLTLIENQNSSAFQQLMQDKITISKAYNLLTKKEKFHKKIVVNTEEDTSLSELTTITVYQRKLLSLSPHEKKKFLPLLKDCLSLVNNSHTKNQQRQLIVLLSEYIAQCEHKIF